MFTGQGTRILLWLVLLSAVIPTACKPPAAAQAADTAVPQSNAANEKGWRIVGKVVNVLANRDTIDPDSPCGKAPCNAIVEVEQVLEMPTTEDNVAAGATIPVHFAFTLAPTSPDLFPFDNINLPGLEPNDTFEATIVHRPLQNQPNRFMVFNYVKHTP